MGSVAREVPASQKYKSRAVSQSLLGLDEKRAQSRAVDIALTVNPWAVASTLMLIAVVLISMHVAVNVVLYYHEPNKLLTHLDRLFDADLEANIPSFFSALLLFVCSALLSLIAFAKLRQPYFRHWLALAAIFLFLSFDEAAHIHESIINWARNFFHASGHFYYAWVIPYGSFALLVFVMCIGFLLHLPARYRWLFLGSGACYVMGAIGFEMLQGSYVRVPGKRLLETALIVPEEFLEMAGIIFFIYSLLSYIARELRAVRIEVVSFRK